MRLFCFDSMLKQLDFSKYLYTIRMREKIVDGEWKNENYQYQKGKL